MVNAPLELWWCNKEFPYLFLLLENGARLPDIPLTDERFRIFLCSAAADGRDEPTTTFLE